MCWNPLGARVDRGEPYWLLRTSVFLNFEAYYNSSVGKTFNCLIWTKTISTLNHLVDCAKNRILWLAYLFETRWVIQGRLKNSFVLFLLWLLIQELINNDCKTRQLRLVTTIKPYSCILHDWNVQVVQDADDDALTSCGADGVVKWFNVDQNLEPILKAIFCKRLHQPSN